MKCSVAQTKMLELERPDRPTPALRAHLASCPACQEWFHAFLQMERSVPLLPVPPSTGREQFLRHLQTDEPLPGRNGTTVPSVTKRIGAARRERGMQKTALATGLAAGLVLFAVGLLAIQNNPGAQAVSRPDPDPLVKNLLKRDLALAKARTPMERVEELKGLTDDLRHETKTLARVSANKQLQTVADLYQKVMREGIATHARKVTDPRGLGDLAFELSEAGREAQLLADAEPNSAAALRQIADAAHEAETEVRKLIPKGEGQP